jgi:hypothetical protein
MVGRYPEEMNVTVYYIPGNPGEALLEPGVKLQTWFMPGIGLCLLGLWAWSGRASSEKTSAAKEILDQQRTLYSGHHDYRGADPAEFPHIDVQYYNRMQRRLERLGFTTLGDLEDVTATRVHPNMRTFIRVLRDGEGTTMAGVYDVKVRGWMRMLQLVGVIPADLRTVDLESEVTNGSFVVTANTLGSDTTGDIPGIRRTRLPQKTPVEKAYALHRAALDEVIGEKPGARLVQVLTMSDSIKSQDRLQKLKNRHKRSIGYIDEKELETIKGEPLSQSDRELAREIEDLKSKDG